MVHHSYSSTVLVCRAETPGDRPALAQGDLRQYIGEGTGYGEPGEVNGSWQGVDAQAQTCVGQFWHLEINSI